MSTYNQYTSSTSYRKLMSNNEFSYSTSQYGGYGATQTPSTLTTGSYASASATSRSTDDYIAGVGAQFSSSGSTRSGSRGSRL